MPIQVPLFNGGNIPLRQTGIQTPRTARLEAGDRGAMGNAVSAIGQALGRMVEQERELADTRELIAFEGKMRQAMDEQSRFQLENQNQDDWLPAWETRRSELQQQLDKTPLSERARLNLTQSFGEFSDRHTLSIRTQAFQQARARTIQAVDNRLMQSVNDGRPEEIPAVLQLANGVLLPEEIEAKRLQYEKQAKAKAEDNLMTEVDTLVKERRVGDAMRLIEQAPLDETEKRNKLTTLRTVQGRQKEKEDLMLIAATEPEKAAELAMQKEKDGAISGLDRVDIIREAEQVQAFNLRDSVTTYKQRIRMGDIPTFEELQNDKTLNDYARFALVEIASGNVNDPAEFERSLVSAMSFDPSQFADEKERITAAANLEASFETRFQGAYLQTLKDELGKRTNPDTVPSVDTDIGPAMKLLDEAIEGGGMGPVTRAKLDPETGKPMMRDPKEIGFVAEDKWYGMRKIKVKENEGQPVPLVEPDPVAQEKAAAVMRDIRRTIESEVKAGKLKDQGAITARAIDLFTAKGGKLLPDTVSPNPLLPAITPEAKTDLNELLDKYGY